ncbi:MAG: tetratricopeptide repeat protein [Cyanobacteria bacterium P01_A01_bin.83]
MKQPFQEISSAKLDSAEAHNNLGNLLMQQGKLSEAISCYRTAIAIEPEMAMAHNNLGNLLMQQGKLSEAISCYQTAIAIKPEMAMAHNNLGNLLMHQGKLSEAIICYQAALRQNPKYHLAKFGITMAQLSVIYANEAEINLSRNNYQQYLENLVDSYQEASEQELSEAAVAAGTAQPFYLAYQGLNDKSLQQTYGELLCKMMATRYPQWSQPLSLPKLKVDQKIRIGIVSGLFHHHSVWKIPLKGWLENIDRSEFELFGYYTGSICDRQTTQAAHTFDHFTHCHYDLSQWAQKIAADDLDVLIFPEFGMNSMTIKLGCLRLAPVQITSWGHPNTSGLPTIDYYLSSDLMEPENAQEYYCEKLIRLPNLGICYHPIPIRTQAISKTELGIKDDEIMFWCCQSLFKYLPQHDDVFPRIAQELHQAKFVFIELESESYTNVFRNRLAASFKQFDLDYNNYCIFLPRLHAEAFLGTTAIADVFLDNIEWSGCNTTLESLQSNIPIVTLPGKFMRGRHTLAILEMLGVESTIAHDKDEYIQIAIRLGQDAAYRHYIAQQIAQNKNKIYGDKSPVRALEDFLFEILNKPRKLPSAINEAFQAGIQYQKANRLAAARQEFLQVIAVQPHHAETLHQLGIIAQQFNQLEEAEHYLSTAVKVQPTLPQSWFSLGNLRQSQGQYQSAEAAYRQALKLRPDSLPICNNLAYVLQQQGNWSGATSYYQRALEIDPQSVAADVNWGNALHAQGKLTPKQQLHYAKLNCKLGLSRYRGQDWQTAITYYRQAISMQPNLADAHFHLGSALQEKRELEEAIACYQRVLELNPDGAIVYYNLGQIYQDLGDLDQATINFKLGLKLINPNYAQALKSSSDKATSFADNFSVPEILLGEVTVGDYQFPAIPALPESEAERPFWSIVIPVVNRPEYFPECLASVLAQWTREEEMEIIVLDNGSDPPQWKIPQDLGKGIVRYYRFDKTISLQENWNTSVSLCRGNWIHLLHHDDYVLPGFYARLKASLATCPKSVGAAFTGYENINEERQVIFSQQHNLANYRGIVADWIMRIGVSCPLSPPSVVIRRTAYEQLGGYKLDLPYTCDWEFYKRVASFYDWWYEPGILAHYRQQSNSITIAENMNGSSGVAHRRAIEISQSYLPTEHREEISAQSRVHFFDWCLNHAKIPLSVGNFDGALSLIKEALKMNNSSQALDALRDWFQSEAAAPLVEQLAQLELDSTKLEQNTLTNLCRSILGNKQQEGLAN